MVLPLQSGTAFIGFCLAVDVTVKLWGSSGPFPMCRMGSVKVCSKPIVRQALWSISYRDGVSDAWQNAAVILCHLIDGSVDVVQQKGSESPTGGRTPRSTQCSSLSLLEQFSWRKSHWHLTETATPPSYPTSVIQGVSQNIKAVQQSPGHKASPFGSRRVHSPNACFSIAQSLPQLL